MEAILVVDDDPETLFATQLILRGQGFDVTTAGNYEEGLERATEGEFSLVVTDLLLESGMRGDDLVVEVSSLLGEAAPPFLIRTAASDLGLIGEALGCGAVSVLHKGTGPTGLVEAVRRALG